MNYASFIVMFDKISIVCACAVSKCISTSHLIVFRTSRYRLRCIKQETIINIGYYSLVIRRNEISNEKRTKFLTILVWETELD